MTSRRPVVVKQLPERVDLQQAQDLARAAEPFLKHDHPCLVFDFSEVRYLNSAGIEMLLHCMEEAMKRNGDVKLAAIPPEIAVILRLTRVDCLFEIFDDASDAVESFHRFLTHPFRHAREATPPGAGAEYNRSQVASSESSEEG